MLIKADKGFVQHVPEDRTNWVFQVSSVDGEIGLIQAWDINTRDPIYDLGHRLEKCIFVSPQEYLELIEELEAMGENAEEYFKMSAHLIDDANNPEYMRGWKEALGYACRLVAQKASPPPGLG